MKTIVSNQDRCLFALHFLYQLFKNFLVRFSLQFQPILCQMNVVRIVGVKVLPVVPAILHTIFLIFVCPLIGTSEL